mgnify:CR=1 FL=1
MYLCCRWWKIVESGTHKELVDKLNVFPVPDGDTGTNMSLTISYAMKELAKVENDSITEIGKSLSKGSFNGS